MSQKASLSAIGAFVLIALGLVVFAAIYFGSGRFFQTKLYAIAYFPGSIRGLTVGSPVEFMGAKIGEITEINVVYSPERRETLVPVFMEIWVDKVALLNEQNELIKSGWEGGSFEDAIKDLGLRARLKTKSLVTGQQAITLGYLPDTPIKRVGIELKGHEEIPTVPSAYDELSDQLQDLDLSGALHDARGMFAAVEKLARNPDIVDTLHEIRLRVAELRQMIEKAVAVFDDVGPAAADALKQANSTLKTAESVLVDVQLASTKTLKQADTTLKTAQAFIHEDSSARHRLDRALEEFGKASEAIRNLAEYINQNPDAFLRGRGQ